jgi:hypothetical protein
MFSGAVTAGRCRWFWDSWATVCCVPSARVADLQQDPGAVGAVQAGESERRKMANLAVKDRAGRIRGLPVVRWNRRICRVPGLPIP